LVLLCGGSCIFDVCLPVLVRAFWEEGKVNEAVEAVRDMEQRGVVGVASVYYELACCLCNNGRWQDAMVEVCLCTFGSVVTECNLLCFIYVLSVYGYYLFDYNFV
jgi:hypothetical protein